MSKRRITQQQSHRIHQKQSRYQERVAPGAFSEGLVIKRYNRIALVEMDDGQRVRCSIRPDIDALVAGDRVLWQPMEHGNGVVLSVLPRQSVLSRPDYRGVFKPVAANISQVMIVVAPIPAISWVLLDSYLVMTEVLHLQACIVLNKTDLDVFEKEAVSLQEQLKAIYQPLGYALLCLSKKNTAQDDALVKTLSGQTSVFVGQSGVGKSSIISRILPEEGGIETQAVSESSSLGQHTTSNSCLYHLACGGHLIDSPGVREFGLWDMPIRNIADGFREFRTPLTQCQFRNCNHQDTPGCAVLEALHEGLISPIRYESYVKLMLKFVG